LKKIIIASDHAGYSLKEYLKTSLIKKKIKIHDVGPKTPKKVDYPDYAHKLSKILKKNSKFIGVLICGSGQGMIMTANKHKNVRAALCYDAKSTKLSRLHNDANVITLGSRLISKKNAIKYLNIFLKTDFEGGRHKKRIKKI
tara:strand:+ start:1785 stop:2210 length:426 start_codon:yes stop_codon:yes gene_type:complete